MKPQHLRWTGVRVLAATLLVWVPLPAAAQTVRDLYTTLQGREEKVLAAISATAADAAPAARGVVIREARSVIAGYAGLTRRFHGSGYADNALFNAAVVAEGLYARFNRAADRTLAEHYYNRLIAEYPTSSLVKTAQPKIAALAASRGVDTTAEAPPDPPAAPTATATASRSDPTRATLTGIERTVLPEGVRITLALDREVSYREERLGGPDRVFFDLKGVQTTPELRDVVLRYGDDAVRQIRIGRHPDSTVRVVLDLEGVRKYSVFTLYNPFRVVVDCEPIDTRPTSNPATPAVAEVATTLPTPPSPAPPAPESTPAAPLPSTSRSAVAPPPAAATANQVGGFSLSRQLGLGIARIVIDPGHGGHDPGALAKGLNEADLTLDVALRLEKLLQQDGLEVVLTRRTNVYVPLEERTAMANRESADLFLSIHANAHKNEAIQGVETYFLSFASTPDAEAVAARENSTSASGMHNLPDIVKAITLNNKLDESRDFARMVQDALVSRLRRSNETLKNLGVKKAPFVVLIGAGMPSVLAEISFLTNKRELQLVKSTAYKQRIAEALQAAVLRYRRSLKGQGQVAEQ